MAYLHTSFGVFLCVLTVICCQAQNLETFHYQFDSSVGSGIESLVFQNSATLQKGFLQLTSDSERQKGQVMLKTAFKLWEQDKNESAGGRVASFYTSFVMNIVSERVGINGTPHPGEGLAFAISPETSFRHQTSGQYLGLFNFRSDGNESNGIVAIEFDTNKQDFDPDDNHIGLDIHSVKSNETVSLSRFGMELVTDVDYHVWIQYDGVNKQLNVYMTDQGTMPSAPLLSTRLDLRGLVYPYSYFGFAAATGENVQISTVLAWNLTVEALQSNTGNNSDEKSRKLIKLALGIGLPGLVLVIVGVVGLIYCARKRKSEEAASDEHFMGALKTLPGMPKEFEFSDLQKATDNFDEKHKLGQGGYGVVYKGILPNDNLHVAIKFFSRENLKGQQEFLSELTIINRLRHKNLVKLLGWSHKKHKLLLVYDYMPNGSLDKHLFCGGAETMLQWKFRYNIISGVAAALHYLHNEYDQRVVHRDLKSSNIMLDSNFNARLGDFGLAIALDNDQTSYTEREGIPGTFGYIAPECFHTSKVTCESDVYGFGAVVLELVTGQRVFTDIGGFRYLADWVWWLHQEDRILDAVDVRLRNEYVIEEANRMLLLGLACSHPVASNRPKAEIILQIVSGTMEVPSVPPVKPAFVWPSSLTQNRSSINGIDVTSGWIPR